jgi:hypothetical protein
MFMEIKEYPARKHSRSYLRSLHLLHHFFILIGIRIVLVHVRLPSIYHMSGLKAILLRRRRVRRQVVDWCEALIIRYGMLFDYTGDISWRVVLGWIVDRLGWTIRGMRRIERLCTMGWWGNIWHIGGTG